MSDSFESLASAAPDGLLMAKLIGESAAGFLKLSLPVGSLLAAAISLGPDVSVLWKVFYIKRRIF